MRRAFNVSVSLLLVPVGLGFGALVGYVVHLPSGNGWYILGTMGVFAFLVGVVAPSRWVAPLALSTLLAAALLSAYGDGDDSCNGRPACEDNIGPWLITWVFGAFILGPTLAGALLQPRAKAWWRRRYPGTVASPPSAQ